MTNRTELSRRNLLATAVAGGSALALGNAVVGEENGTSTKISTDVDVVSIEPVLARVELPITDHTRSQLMDLADASFETGEARHGHGRCSGAEVTVQIGTSADIEIDFEVNAISEETFNTWKSESRRHYSSDSWSYLNERHSGRASAGGFLLGSFGYFGARGNYSHYRNKRDTFRSSSSSQSQGFFRSVHNLDNSTLRMKGRLRAYGVSYIPVTVSAYINVLIITFADGKTLRAVNRRNPVAANPQTLSTTGAGSQPTTLNEVPIS